MKLFVYLLSITALLALTGLFYLKQPNGKAWLSVNDLLPKTQTINEKINSATNKLRQIYDNQISDKNIQVKVYRWQDSNGNWSYSDKPQASIESEEVLFDHKDIIVLPAFEVPTKDVSNFNSTPVRDSTSSKSLAISTGKVKGLYNDVNNVQQLMDAREQSISQAIKDSGG